MNHPTREELVSYLYDDLEFEARRTVERHLGQCAECRGSVAGWRGVGGRLDGYAVTPSRLMSPPAWQPLTRWAMVAVTASAILFAGFMVGRMTGVSRAELEAVKREAQSAATAIARNDSERRLREFALNTDQRLLALQSQQTADYAALTKKLETVAVLTEAGFRQTEKQFVQLADAGTRNPPALFIP